MGDLNNDETTRNLSGLNFRHSATSSRIWTQNYLFVGSCVVTSFGSFFERGLIHRARGKLFFCQAARFKAWFLFLTRVDRICTSMLRPCAAGVWGNPQ